MTANFIKNLFTLLMFFISGTILLSISHAYAGDENSESGDLELRRSISKSAQLRNTQERFVVKDENGNVNALYTSIKEFYLTEGDFQSDLGVIIKTFSTDKDEFIAGIPDSKKEAVSKILDTMMLSAGYLKEKSSELRKLIAPLNRYPLDHKTVDEADKNLSNFFLDKKIPTETAYFMLGFDRIKRELTADELDSWTLKMRANPKFADWPSIDHYLTKPIQRPMRWKLLLKDINKRFPFEVPNLNLAEKQAERLANYLNTKDVLRDYDSIKSRLEMIKSFNLKNKMYQGTILSMLQISEYEKVIHEIQMEFDFEKSIALKDQATKMFKELEPAIDRIMGKIEAEQGTFNVSKSCEQAERANGLKQNVQKVFDAISKAIEVLDDKLSSNSKQGMI